MDGENAGTRRITSSVLSDYLYPGIILEPGTYTIGLKGGDLAQDRYVFVDVVRFPAVTSPNEPPVGIEDSATVEEDSGATTIDVLANDTDDDGDPLTIASVSNPAHGTAVVESGKVKYTPNANYNGPDSFSYTVSDGNGETDTATVSITVNSVDDAPVAEDDSATTPEDTAVSIDVLANDTDGGDGGTMTIESVTQPANGTVTITGGGSGLTYEPDENYCNGGSPTDDFTYTLNGGSEAKVSVTVTCVDDDPVAVNDNKTVAEDDPATTIDVLANDTDGDGGPKTIESVTQPQNGTVEITNNGNDLTYKPNANYCNGGSPTDDFTYTLNGGSSATVAVTVTCVEDDPVAVNDSATKAEDSGATPIDVLNNDTDPDGGSKTISSVTQPTNGTVVITNGGADLTYEPNADYCNDSPGTNPDTFTYTLSPGGSTATVSVKVTCVDDPPVAVNDSATVLEDAAATNVPVLTNDTDIDGGPKTISSASDPANGTVVVTGGGSGLTYQPDPNYCNDPPATNLDTFTYTLNGGSQGSVSMKVTCVNDNPVATDETFNGTSRAIGNTSLVVNDPTDGAPDPNGPQKTVSGDILSNDTDVDGPGPLAVQAVSNKATTDGGSVNIEADGDFTFHPKAGTSCTDHTDSFDYTLTDGNTPTAGTDTGTVNIDIQDCVWYVDSSLGTNGDGRSHSPFNSLSGINGAGGTGDADSTDQKLFLYDGTYSGGLPLENGQTLFSQRHGLVVPDGGSGNVTLEAAVPAGPNTTITGGLTLGSGNTIQGIHLGNATGGALSGASVGNATMNTTTSGAIDNQSGKAVDISNGTLNMAFTAVSSNNSTTDGIRLDNTAGTFNASGGSIQNANGEDIDISGNNSGDTVNFNYDGSITDDLGTLVNVSGQNGGTKDFNGAITDGNDGDGFGIALTNNTGATIRFDGGLTLSTGGTNTPFLAVGGGTVVVTDPAGATDNTLASTTGTALNVTNTTIGSDDLTFRSISANGASNGIALTNTGPSGGLTVTGNGGTCTSATTCTGGAIQNSTGTGVSLTSVPGGVSLTRIFVNDSADDGLGGSNVTGLTLDNAMVSSNGNVAQSGGVHGEHGVDFTDLTGTVTFTSSNVSNNIDSNVVVSNNSGTLNMSVNGGTYSGATGGMGDGLFVEGLGTGSQNLNVQAPITFANNVGDHIQHSADADNTTDSDVTINNATMTSPPAAGGGPFCANNILGGGITVSHGCAAVGGSNLDLTITNNNIQNSCIGAIAVGTTGSVGDQQSARVDATIQNNTIGTAGVAGSGSVQGNGIFVDSNGNGLVRTLITGNVIRQWTNRNGIALDILDGDAEMSATVRGNILTEPNSAFAGTSTRGMTIQLGAQQTGDSIDACLDIGHPTDAALKNQVAGTSEPPQPDIRYLHEGPGSVVQLAGYSGPTTPAIGNIVSYLQPRNNLVANPTVSGIATAPGGSTTTSVASCPLPAG